MVSNLPLPLLRAPAGRPGVRRFLAFTLGSGAGLITDLSIFAVLNALGVPATAANLVSTAAAITVTYFLVTRHSFDAIASWRTYTAFFAWYGASAIVVSVAIGALGAGREDMNLVWKLAFVPVTFASNFLFSRWLFRGTARAGVPLAARWSARRGVRRPARPVGRRAQRFVDLVGGHPWVASLAATTLFLVFVFPLNDAVSFPAEVDVWTVFRQQLTRIAFALCLLALVRWVIRFSVGVIQRDPHYRRWLLASAAYLVVLLPIFIAIYPGHWVFDEFDTVYGATHFFPVAWQGYLTNVYYQFCMFLLPSAVGIVVVQMVFIAVVAGYVATVVASRLRSRWLSAAVLLALLSPAVLLNNFYPLRLTAYGYLLLLVLVHLLRRAGEARVPRPAEFFAFSCAIAVLAFWRTEGVMTLLLLPVGFVVLGMTRLVRPAPVRLLGVVASGLAVIVFSGWLSTSTVNPTYQYTAMINPISTMLQGDLQGPNVEEDLRAVDSVIDIDAVRSMPSYTETPAFWTAGIRQGAETKRTEFTRAYVDLVVHNPGLFLENRWNAFLAANSQTSWAPQVQVSGINGSNAVYVQKFTAFAQSTPFASPLNLQLKYQTARHLFLLDYTLRPTILTAIVWNAIPSIVVVLLALGVALLRRRWVLAVSAAAVFGSAVLVFLTEPASYFMYFFPVYLVGLVGGAAALALIADRAIERRRQRGAQSRAVAPETDASSDSERVEEPVGALSR